jgi:hypothetical protein
VTSGAAERNTYTNPDHACDAKFGLAAGLHARATTN